jgi:hypothetical protein
VHLGVVGPGGPNTFVPNIVTDKLVFGAGGFYDIGIDPGGGRGRHTYLPGGDWTQPTSDNHLPGPLNGFVFLEVDADLSALGYSGIQKVFVPCYFKQ